MDVPHEPDQPLERLHGVKVVLARYGWHETTLSRNVRAGRFPAPRMLLGRRYWSESELSAWEREEASKPRTPKPGAANLRPGGGR